MSKCLNNATMSVFITDRIHDLVINCGSPFKTYTLPNVSADVVTALSRT